MKKFTFIVTDESLNNYGFRILTDGIDTTQFLKNPVAYYMHDRRAYNPKGDEVIGRWENLRVEKNGIMMADVVLDETDEKAMKIAQKIENNILRMASIGVNPIETSDAKEYLLKGQTRPTVTKSELIEISIVDRGGNNNALVKLYDDANSDHELPLLKNHSMDLKQKLEGILELSDGGSVVDAVKALQSNESKYKKLYEDLKQKIDADKDAEAVSLVQKAIDGKHIDEAQKEAYIALFKADYDNAKTVLETLMTGTKKPDASKKLETLIDSLEGQGAEKGKVEKNYRWYELNDPEALLQMKENEPEKFEKLFNEYYK